ncbi:MAG TPA: hypothetical protein VGL56_15040 [Fimbriimonadaceae bacterium]|jgi:prepilin-type processing-associated H-X9-DG protein
MIPPSDPCIGLGTSIYGTAYDSGLDNYFSDIYPPMDYLPNPVLSSWNPGCTSSSGVGSIAGANLDTGDAPVGSTGYIGGGFPTAGETVGIISPAKAVLITDFPLDNSIWPGSTFWGSAYTGLHNGTTNVAFCDSHAHSYANTQLEPYGYEAAWNLWPYDGSNPKSGTMYPLWGTNQASPPFQQ